MLLKLNTVVGNSVLILPSSFRLPFCHDPKGFYYLQQFATQSADRPLYFSSKSNNIRFDFPNYLSLDLLGVNTNMLYIPFTFSLPLSLPCKALNPTLLLYDCRQADFSLTVCKFPSPAFFKEVLRLLSSTPQNISYQSTGLFCPNRDSPWGWGKQAFEALQCKMQSSSTCLEDTITPPRRTAFTTLYSTLLNNKTPVGAILLLLLLFTCSLSFHTVS